MTRNPVGDSEQFSATYWSSIYNAHNQEGVLNGLVPSKGSGDFDIDTTSGEALVQSTKTGSVNSQSPAVALNTSDSDDRVDLVHINSAGTISKTTGTAATDPNAPDIPSGEVLLAAVLVEGGASSLSSAGSKIADYRTIYDNNPALDSIGDGSGTARFETAAAETRLLDEAGQNAFVANDGSHNRMFARSSTPIEFRDAVGGISAGSYSPGASAPNTWDWGGHDFTNINSVSTEKLASDYIFAGSYDGSDADTRLGNAISDLSGGQVLMLESGDYGTDRTFSSDQITVTGPVAITSASHQTGTSVDARWTFDGTVTVENLAVLSSSGNGLVFNGDYSTADNVSAQGDGIVVNASRCLINNLGAFSSVTFASGTSDGTVGVRSSDNVTITDNGTNNIMPLS